MGSSLRILEDDHVSEINLHTCIIFVRIRR